MVMLLEQQFTTCGAWVGNTTVFTLGALNPLLLQLRFMALSKPCTTQHPRSQKHPCPSQRHFRASQTSVVHSPWRPLALCGWLEALTAWRQFGWSGWHLRSVACQVL